MFTSWQNQRKIESKLACIVNSSALCNSGAMDAPRKNRLFKGHE